VGLHWTELRQDQSCFSSPYPPFVSAEGAVQMANVSLQGQMKAWSSPTVNAGFPLRLRLYDDLSLFLLTS